MKGLGRRSFCALRKNLWVSLARENLPSHRKVIHIVLSQNTLCKRLFIHIRKLLAPPNTICMCKRANFNMYRVVVSAYLYIFENSWPNRILYVCLYFRWRCTSSHFLPQKMFGEAMQVLRRVLSECFSGTPRKASLGNSECPMGVLPSVFSSFFPKVGGGQTCNN